MNLELETQIRKIIIDIFKKNIIGYRESDITRLIEITNQFNNAGYKITYSDVTEFLVNKKNIEMLQRDGLTRTLEALSQMKLGAIKKDTKPGRNEPCFCGSEKKYKKCCIN